MKAPIIFDLEEGAIEFLRRESERDGEGEGERDGVLERGREGREREVEP